MIAAQATPKIRAHVGEAKKLSDIGRMTRMIPAEEFRKFASECLANARSSRSRDSKATWDHMATRWMRCAEISEQQAAVAKLDRMERRHAGIRNGRVVAA
jgi:hypothetical protein